MNTVHEKSRIFQKKFMNCSVVSRRGKTDDCKTLFFSLNHVIHVELYIRHGASGADHRHPEAAFLLPAW